MESQVGLDWFSPQSSAGQHAHLFETIAHDETVPANSDESSTKSVISRCSNSLQGQGL
jgi:hypothetical protein